MAEHNHQTNSSTSQKNKSKSPLIWMIALTLAPFILAVLAYQYRWFSSTKNFGLLVQPQVNLLEQIPNNSTIKNSAIPTAMQWLNEKQQSKTLNSYQGKWLLIYLNPKPCNNATTKCLEHLYAIRQLRLTQGREANRIAPMYFYTGAINASSGVVLSQYAQPASHINFFNLDSNPQASQVLIQKLNIAYEHANKTSDKKSTKSLNFEESLFLVDPNGHIMLYYNDIKQPNLIIRDIRHLFKWSRIG